MTYNEIVKLINKDNRLLVLFSGMLFDIILLIALIIFAVNFLSL
jgi:hypothetical protein